MEVCIAIQKSNPLGYPNPESSPVFPHTIGFYFALGGKTLPCKADSPEKAPAELISHLLKGEKNSL